MTIQSTGRVDIDRVLMQMRAMKTEAQGQVAGVGTPLPNPNEVQKAEGTGFGKLLTNAVNKVNDTQMQAASLAKRFEVGDESVELPEVMIALQKSSVAFQAMTQVRNKLVKAYEDVMNMPI